MAKFRLPGKPREKRIWLGYLNDKNEYREIELVFDAKTGEAVCDNQDVPEVQRRCPGLELVEEKPKTSKTTKEEVQESETE